MFRTTQKWLQEPESFLISTPDDVASRVCVFLQTSNMCFPLLRVGLPSVSCPDRIHATRGNFVNWIGRREIEGRKAELLFPRSESGDVSAKLRASHVTARGEISAWCWCWFGVGVTREAEQKADRPPRVERIVVWQNRKRNSLRARGKPKREIRGRFVESEMDVEKMGFVLYLRYWGKK